MTALLPLLLHLAPACLEEPDEAADAAVAAGQPGEGAQPRPPQPAGRSLGPGQAPDGSLPPNPEGGAHAPDPRTPGPLKVALVPSSRSVLLYKALVNKMKGDRKESAGSQEDRGDEGGPGELEGQTPKRDALADVQLLRPGGAQDTLSPLEIGRDAFKEAVGTYEDPISQPSAGLQRVEDALLTGEVDCAALPAARLIGLADQDTDGGQASVLVAQLGMSGGDNSDLVVAVRQGASTETVPRAAKTGATEGLDARLLLSGLVDGQHQVLGDDALAGALSAGTVDLVVGPRDSLQAALDSGAAVPFRALTAAEAAPSAQVLACRVQTLGSEEARDALRSLLRVYRGYLKRKGDEDPTAQGGHYPHNARVDVDVLRSMLGTLKGQELVGNAALEIVDLQALDEAGAPPEGPLGASSILVDNRLVASHGGGGPGGSAADNDLELPPPPEAP